MNRMKSTVVLAFAALALGSGSVVAKPNGAGRHVTFEMLDADGNGEVSEAEMRGLAARHLKAADADNDGAISEAELRAHVVQRVERSVEHVMGRLDENDDGIISADEMPEGNRLAKQFGRFDADGNGSLSPEEFEAARDRMGKRR